MANNTFERRREEIINFVSDRLIGASDSRAAKMVTQYCLTYGITAKSSDIVDMATEAVRRRMVEKIKQLDDRVVTLRNQLIALNAKVNSYHP